MAPPFGGRSSAIDSGDIVRLRGRMRGRPVREHGDDIPLLLIAVGLNMKQILPAASPFIWGEVSTQ